MILQFYKYKISKFRYIYACNIFRKNGSIIGYQNQIYHAIPPQYKAINAVGSGDAFVAGIAIGLKRNYPIIDIIKLGSACGTANVLEAESGFVSKDNVEKYLI